MSECFKNVINFSEKQKHTRPGYHTEPATILAFSGNDRFCLVKYSRACLYRTKDLSKGQQTSLSVLCDHTKRCRVTPSAGGSNWCSLRLELILNSLAVTAHALLVLRQQHATGWFYSHNHEGWCKGAITSTESYCSHDQYY